MADNPETDQREAAGGSAPDAGDLTAKYAELQKAYEAKTREADELQRLKGRMSGELGQLRQVAQQYEQLRRSQEDDAGPATPPSYDPNELEAIRQEQGLIGVRAAYGEDWAKYESEVMEIANDPNRAPDFAVTRNGKVNYKASYGRIMDHLLARDLAKARREAAASTTRSSATPQDGTISGVSASEPPADDSEAMRKFLKAAEDPSVSSDDLMRLGIKAGVYKVNPANPPRYLDGKS